MDKIIEIPFVVKDSELQEFEYAIPQGYEAEIKGGKVIVKKVESDDDKIGKELIRFITICDESDEKELQPYRKWIAWLEAILEKKGEQKPIEEANGEDYGIDSLWHAVRILEKTYGKVDGYQTDDGILAHECAITAVKKLKVQKPVEWSEEDRYNLSSIEGMIHTLKGDGRSADRLIAWLNSLRPQKQWKPSEEQITALAYFKSSISNKSSLYGTLEELLKQLKAL